VTEPGTPEREPEAPASAPAGELDAAIAELERAAQRLRAEEIDADEAAELVERCAQLAAAAGAALDRQAAAAQGDPAPGQESLL
jgi:exonuclease VII small subunit